MIIKINVSFALFFSPNKTVSKGLNNKYNNRDDIIIIIIQCCEKEIIHDAEGNEKGTRNLSFH